MSDQTLNDDAEQQATSQIARRASAITALAALGLAVLYALGGQDQLEGVLLALALGGLGYGFVVSARKLCCPRARSREDREPLRRATRTSRASRATSTGSTRASEGTGNVLARAAFLLRMFGAAGRRHRPRRAVPDRVARPASRATRCSSRSGARARASSTSRASR